MLNVAGGKVRTGITLDQAGGSPSEGGSSLVAFHQGCSGVFMTQCRCRASGHTLADFHVLDPIYPGDTVV